MTIKGCPVFLHEKQNQSVDEEAGFASWEVTSVGKLHCVLRQSARAKKEVRPRTVW